MRCSGLADSQPRSAFAYFLVGSQTLALFPAFKELEIPGEGVVAQEIRVSSHRYCETHVKSRKSLLLGPLFTSQAY